MKVVLTDRFKRRYSKLSHKEAELVKEKIGLLIENPRHPSLRMKRMKGKAGRKGIFRIRISKSLRLTFKIEEDVFILRQVGRHDETIIHP